MLQVEIDTSFLNSCCGMGNGVSGTCKRTVIYVSLYTFQFVKGLRLDRISELQACESST